MSNSLDARDARIAELEKQVAVLTELVAVLKQQLGRNSRNSSKPPSSDGPGARAGKTEKSEKQQGGQPGHKGHRRELIDVAKVEAVVERYPAVCESCWQPLPQIRDEEAMRHQVTELPEIKPHVTEYRLNTVKCACGHHTQAEANQVPSSAFGPRLTALVGTLTGEYHLSRRQTERVLNDVFEIQMSLGAVSAIERRVTEAVSATYDEILKEVLSAKVNFTDATPWLFRGKHQSLWTLACEVATCYQIFVNGARDTVRPWLEKVSGILVSDRAPVLSFIERKKRQVCWAHLLRQFVGFSEMTGPARDYGHALTGFALLLFEYWQAFESGQLTKELFLRRMKPLQRDVETCLRKASKQDIKGLSGSCKDILNHREALWAFVEIDGVPPTNNHAERELRPFVIWRKRSFGSQSERGNLFSARVMSVVRTAHKQGRNAYRFLTRCVEALFSGVAPPPLLLHAGGSG